MKLIMTGLDHRRASLEIREKFALTKEKTGRILASITESGIGGCVIISTCNRTELYASVRDYAEFEPSKMLCNLLGRDFTEFEQYFTEAADEQVIKHLCRAASGVDSQILGDDQIITQVREALELSRNLNCTDSYIETMFMSAIKAAKVIKTKVILKTLGAGSVAGEAVEKLKTLISLSGRNAVVIGNGQIGRLVSELLIREKTNVTITLRQYKKGVIHVPGGANTISYSERYTAIEQADIVVSATTSPHFTVTYDEYSKLSRLPEIIVDLAVPRDVEPEIQKLVTLLTIDDISRECRKIPLEIVSKIDSVIEEYIGNYYRWLSFKESALLKPAGGLR